jgi:hypothetical protein
MRTNISARLARLEASPEMASIRYTISSQMLPEGEWRDDLAGLTSAEDDDRRDPMTEAEWIATYSVPERGPG